MTHLPHNLDIERGVIASCFLGGAAEAIESLTPDDFYRDAHKIIFDHIGKTTTSEKTELSLLVNSIRGAGKIKEVGGASHVSKLMDFPCTTNLEDSCKKLKEFAALRKTIFTCNEIINNCADPGVSAAKVLDTAQSDILKIDLNTRDKGPKPFGQICEESFSTWEQLSEKGKSVTGVTSGFYELDRITNGFQNEDYIILAARPSIGKTALSLNIAKNAAQAGHPVGFFSLEMGERSLCARTVSKESRINGNKFRSSVFFV